MQHALMMNKRVSQIATALPRASLTRTLSAQRVAVAGGLLGAVATASCCIAPLVLFGLGIGGAWIGSLTRLAPYQPYFLTAATICLGFGHWLVRRARRQGCADGGACRQPLTDRLVMSGLVVATALVVAAVGFDLLAPFLLGL